MVRPCDHTHAAYDTHDTVRQVYDVTKFARFHPGGKAFIQGVAGTDATPQFYEFHRQDVLRGMAAKYHIGTVADPPPKHKASVVLEPGELSKVPYAEASAFQGLPSAYYKPSHHRFRADLRKFFDEEVMPDAVAFDAQVGTGGCPRRCKWATNASSSPRVLGV